MSISDFAGWVPAIVLPVSTFIQLAKILKERKRDGVSWISWALFGFANIGAYVFTENWFKIQAVLAFALSAVLDFVIVGAYWKIRLGENKNI